MGEFVEAVAKEVIRLLKAMEEKKVLVVLMEDTDAKALDVLLTAYEAGGLVPTFLSFVKEPMPEGLHRFLNEREVLRSSILGHLDRRTFLKGYEGILVTEMDFPQLQRILQLELQGDLGKLLFETLRQGKPVHVLARDLEDVNNPVLWRKMKTIGRELQSLGLTALSPEDVKKGKERNAETRGDTQTQGDTPPREEALVKEERMDVASFKKSPMNSKKNNPSGSRHYVALKDLLTEVKYKGGKPRIFLPEEGVFTMAAEEYIKEKGIEVVRK